MELNHCTIVLTQHKQQIKKICDRSAASNNRRICNVMSQCFHRIYKKASGVHPLGCLQRVGRVKVYRRTLSLAERMGANYPASEPNNEVMEAGSIASELIELSYIIGADVA